MFSFIDDFLNRITMYRLVLYYLIVVWVAALVLSFFGLFPFSPLALAASMAIILAVSWGVNVIFSSAYGAATGVESVYITALILALILPPAASLNAAGAAFLIFASAWAMGSKYLIAPGKKHIFNPAAFGAALAALALGTSANWWSAGSIWLAPLVIIGGILVVRKLRRTDLVLSFFGVALATTFALTPQADWGNALSGTFLHSALFFLAFVMLTEPLTMPPGRVRRIIYAGLVGLLFAPQVNIFGYYFAPEVALLVGNLFAWFVSPKGRFMLTLIEKKALASGVYEFAFASDKPLRFAPGQYLEWTLPHAWPDARGNRRYFTVASSPTEPAVRLGVKFYDPPSTFKRSLAGMRRGMMLSASHVAGEFTLPKDRGRKLVFIAGGIGVTPFRSMVQYLLDRQEKRSVALLYSNKTAGEIAYREVFDRASREIGMKTVYAVTDDPAAQGPGIHNGYIDARLIATEIPDYRERTFYISGPRGMVEAFKKTLHEMGVSRWRIKTDYFPGFA